MKEKNPFHEAHKEAKKNVDGLQPIWDNIARSNFLDSLFTKIVSVLALLVSIASLAVAIIALLRA